MSLKNLKRLTDAEALALLESQRWPNGPTCPHCGSRKAIELKGKKYRAGLRHCQDCREQYSPMNGTIMEDSALPLRFWMYAIHAMMASKKGVSALQLQRELSELYDGEIGRTGKLKAVSYRTAWFVAMRIREGMRDSSSTMLGGPGVDVEVDETFIGGRPRPGGPKNSTGTVKGRTPVLALVERSGRVRTRVIADVTANSIRPVMFTKLDFGSNLHTDTHGAYLRLGNAYPRHTKISHSTGKYVGPDGACTNTVESYFALLKRGITGSFHSVSRKHLSRYCDEFNFRWDHRKVSDSERAMALLGQISGKRLTYREPRSNSGPAR